MSEVLAVIGGGAREWALAESITKSKNVSEVHVLPGNLGGAFESVYGQLEMIGSRLEILMILNNLLLIISKRFRRIMVE